MSAMVATKKAVEIRMIQRETSVPKIAREIGVTPEAVRQTVAGRLRSPRLRSAIAASLGWPESRIWADAARKPQTEQVA